MLKLPLCEAVIKLSVEAKSPLLISRAVRDGTDWVESQGKRYIPASSIKGVLRSHSERILRSFDKESACDPFLQDRDELGGMTKSCSKRLEEKELLPAEIYRGLCLACRLFGCTAFAGRVYVDDVALASEKNPPVNQLHVSIDRFTQGVANGPFTRIPAFPLEFGTELKVQNFELWQLALLALVFKDFNEGLASLGSGGRRGHGQVFFTVKSLELGYLKNKCGLEQKNDSWQLDGLAKFMPKNQREAYDLKVETPFSFQTREEIPECNGWQRFTLQNKALMGEFFDHCVKQNFTSAVSKDVKKDG